MIREASPFPLWLPQSSWASLADLFPWQSLPSQQLVKLYSDCFSLCLSNRWYRPRLRAIRLRPRRHVWHHHSACFQWPLYSYQRKFHHARLRYSNLRNRYYHFFLSLLRTYKYRKIYPLIIFLLTNYRTPGCLFGAISILSFGDYLGRRHSMMMGGSVMILGVIIQVTAQAHSNPLAQFIVGRVITGVGNGINTSTIPTYQAECSKTTNRGLLICVEGGVIAFGTLVAYVCFTLFLHEKWTRN